MKRRLFAAILLAFLLSIALGSLYGRHGGAVISILAPINRSVWELTKLTFWPFLFVSILALIRLGALPAHFLAAQCSALFCMQAAVFFALLVLNQCYGLHSDAVDNAVCLTALAAGLILAYFFYRSGHTNGLLPVMG
ncbi:DUF6512 family protein, partial [Oscillospiraceae bacterium OttesenSCG-928-G22]|nr:DUF6512 family protein [Oscillospiraceae bacterium OttesenSCG-928-G22]